MDRTRPTSAAGRRWSIQLTNDYQHQYPERDAERPAVNIAELTPSARSRPSVVVPPPFTPKMTGSWRTTISTASRPGRR